jgi:hypothetical protein
VLREHIELGAAVGGMPFAHKGDPGIGIRILHALEEIGSYMEGGEKLSLFEKLQSLYYLGVHPVRRNSDFTSYFLGRPYPGTSQQYLDAAIDVFCLDPCCLGYNIYSACQDIFQETP